MSHYQTIYGWFDWHDTYDRWVRHAPPGARLVEVGAFKGRSTAYLLSRVVDWGRGDVGVYVVDNWVGEPTVCGGIKAEFLKNLKAFAPYFQVIDRPSVEAAREFQDGSVHAVWIDGDHTYAAVYNDLDAWWPKVAAGGEIGGHDYGFTSVSDAVKTWCRRNRVIHEVVPSSVPHESQMASWLIRKAR
jgi:hypothetical protein